MKTKIIRIVSVFSVFLFLFAGFGVLSVSAAESTSFLNQPYYYLNSTEPVPYLSDFMALPYVNSNTFIPYDPSSDSTEYADFRSFRPTPFNLSSPDYNFTSGSPSVGSPLGVNFALLYRDSETNSGYPFLREDLFSSPTGFIKVSCSFYSTQYFTSDVPYVYFLYFDDLDPNVYPDPYSPLFYVASDFIHFDLKCERDKSSHPWTVAFNMYIPVEYMRSLDFSVMTFTLQRDRAANSGFFNLSCKSLSVDLVPDADFPSSVPAPDTSTNDQLDSIEDELNSSVKDFANGGTQSNGNPSGGASIDESLDLRAGVNDSPFLPNTDPVFFDSPPQFQAISEFSVDPLYGMQFWSHILSALIQLPGIELLFKISLSVGLFAFLFGLIGSIISKVDRDQKSKKRERQRKREREKSQRRSKKSSSDGGG